MASAITGYASARHSHSALGQLSAAKSTLIAATYIPGRDKRLVFASEWVFKPEGIRAVKIKLRDALRKSGLVSNN
jgi:hypothetical protein